MSSQKCSLSEYSSPLTLYVFCNPTFWMIVACSLTSALTLSLVCFIEKSFKKHLRRLEFASWKIEQLAERIRLQEPNPLLIEQITKKLNDINREDQRFFMPKSNVKIPEEKELLTMVKQQRDEDEAKLLKDAKIGTMTKVESKEGNSQKSAILKVTKAMLHETKEMLTMGGVPSEKKAVEKPSYELA